MLWLDLAVVCLMMWGAVNGYQAGWRKALCRLGGLLCATLTALLSRKELICFGARHSPLERVIETMVAVSYTHLDVYKRQDLSFSLALLDRNLNGVILTSLFGREESRCYGKPVKQGQSSHYLSDEENQALEEARRQINARRR